MKRTVMLFAMFSFILASWVVADDEITGAVSDADSPHIAALTSKVCDENPYALCYVFCGPTWNFNIAPSAGCHFESDSDYYVSASAATIDFGSGEAYQAPGDPIALFGPFNVDASGNYSCGTITEISSGDFEGTINNADARFIAIDSIKMQIEHHYLGQNISSGEDIDYFGSAYVAALENLTPIGGGAYTYRMEGVASGAKRVTFFSDANNNSALDGGEQTYVVSRDVGVVGHQYDDSVDVDLLALEALEKAPIPASVEMRAQPNPFNSAVSIIIMGFTEGDRLTIRDFRGCVVNEFPAEPCIVWDAHDRNGAAVPSGVYFATLKKNTRVRARICLIR